MVKTALGISITLARGPGCAGPAIPDTDRCSTPRAEHPNNLSVAFGMLKGRHMRASTAYFAGIGTVTIAIAAGLGSGLLISEVVNPKAAKTAQPTKLERSMSSEPIRDAAAVEPAAPAPASQIVAAVPAQSPVQPENHTAPGARPVAQVELAPGESFAKARDTDIKRNAEDRQNVDKRHTLRRNQWVERRHREQDPRAVVESARQKTEPRQEFVIERREPPLFSLFGTD